MWSDKPSLSFASHETYLLLFLCSVNEIDCGGHSLSVSALLITTKALATLICHEMLFYIARRLDSAIPGGYLAFFYVYGCPYSCYELSNRTQ